LAAAALARLRLKARQQRRRHEQCMGRALRRRHHRGFVPEALRQARPSFRPLRSLRMAAVGSAARPQWGRAAGRAGGVCALEGGMRAMSEAAAEATPTLDPRRNVFRPDLAAKSLYGKVSAPNYAPGFPAQVARSAVPLRSRPVPSNGFETEALFGEVVTVYDERDGWAWVQLQRDRYVGYVPLESLSREILAPTHRVRALGTFVYALPEIKSPPVMHLSLNAEICV